jgi:16S rRNA (cytidine1402-2'-O)-methyltransferase
MPLAVCATPIGNLADVTLRVLEELGAADLVLCEDTRHTRILEWHGITARLSSYHRHNEEARGPAFSSACEPESVLRLSRTRVFRGSTIPALA